MKTVGYLMSLLLVLCYNTTLAQNVFDPSDPVITYDSSALPGSVSNPNQPDWNVMGKWIRTPRVDWNTSNFKSYIWNGMQFRLRFPNNYDPLNATKYPVMVFFHGGGEIAGIHDNEFQLLWGAQLFEQRINNNEWNGFMIFPQEPVIGWDDFHFSRLNSILDTLQKYNHTDPDRVISTGLSAGGYGSLAYASRYPGRIATVIAASPYQAASLSGTIGDWVHIPVWFANGGQDLNPDPITEQSFYTAFRNSGGNIFQSYYAFNGHNTWVDMWNMRNKAGNLMTDTYWNRAHKAQPLLYFQHAAFCEGETIAAKMGITPGYFAYEWEKDGGVLPGANTNEFTATQPGSYRVRFMREASGNWSEWTPNPVIITSKTCEVDTLYAEHFTADNDFTAAPVYNRSNFATQNGIITSGTTLFTEDAAGVQGNRFLVDFTDTAAGYTYQNGDLVWGNPSPINVTPNTMYEYSFYLGNQNGTSPAKLVPIINGTALIVDSASADGAGNLSWKKFTYQWNSGNATTALLSLANKESVTVGNEFAIDEISFRKSTVLPVPACVINISPVSGTAVNSQTSANLEWHSTPTATSYDVYIWSGANSPAAPTVNVTGTTYTATGLLPGTVYKWYISPRNASGPASGCAANNTTTFTTAAVPVPTCTNTLAPANGAVIASQTTANLVWASAAYAESYDIYIWTGPIPSAFPVANVLSTSYNTFNLTPGTLYSWYVSPKNASGAAVGCAITNTSSFTTSAVIIPVPGCTTNNVPAAGATVETQTSAALSWASSISASSYDIYIWSGATMPTTAIANVSGTSYTATGLLPGTSYNWFIAPRNASGAAVGCSANNMTSFTTAAIVIPAPPCVTNTAPINGSVISSQTSANLVWSTAPTAISYDLYIWTGTTAPATPTANVAGTNYTATGLLPGTIYKWYIAPRNASGAAIGCSANNTTSFTTTAIVIPAPTCVTNTAPANGVIIASQTSANLVWSAAPTAISYDLYIWTGTTAPTTPSNNVVGTNYNATGLLPGTIYNWFIAPRNASGAAVGCSANNTTIFTTAAVPIPVPGCAVNIAPANGSTVSTQTTATLNWTPVANVSSYDVYLWTGGAMPATTTSNVTDASYTATGLLPGTTYNWYIAPRNASGAASGCSVNNTTSFTTASVPIPVPGCTMNIAPANGSTVSSQTTATLNWTPVANASSYDVYLWTGATIPSISTSTVTAASYTATGLLAATTYNWYVVPRNASGSAIGCSTNNSTSFTTAAIVIPAPPCVANTAPANGTTIVSQNSADLAWSAAPTATSYDLYIWTGATPPATPTTNIPGTNFTAAGLLPGTIYNWYVAPRNASGAAVGCSANNTTSFTTTAAPIPVPGCTINTAPSNGSTISTQTTATLTWTPVANASSYDIYLWTGVVMPATPTSNVSDASYAATALLPGTSYNWYVAPRNASGAAFGCAANNTTSFTTAAAPIPAPGCTINTAPSNGSTISTQTTATLIWTPLANASSYDVYLWAGDAMPVTPTSNVADASYTATGLLPGTVYNWFVAPRNASGTAVGCSANNTTSFTTASEPISVPACIVNIAPANGSAVSTQTTATLIWTSVANATSYDVYLWTGVVMPATPTSNVTDASYTATALLPGTSYNWYVAPRNASGAAVGCSANNTTNFTTAAVSIPVPGCTMNIAPADGSTVATQTPATLTWTSVANASSYDVYLWTGVVMPATPTSNVTDASYTATALLPGTSYNWYVAPRNASGAAIGCSTTNQTSFTTAPVLVPAPPCTVNLSPASGTTITDQTSVSLVWTRVSQASSYDVYFLKGATAPTMPIANVSDTVYQVNGLTPATTYQWYIVPRNKGGTSKNCAVNNTSTFTTATPDPDTINGLGLIGDYYNNPNLAGKIILSRIDPVVNFDWTNSSPSNLIDPRTFSVRWTGQVQPKYSEQYTFYTYCDNGARLWVNGQLLIDSWKDHTVEEKSATISLKAGIKYSIKIEYYEKKGTAIAQLSWSSSSTAKAIVPKNCLFPEYSEVKKPNDHSEENNNEDRTTPATADVTSVLVYPNPLSQGQNGHIRVFSKTGGAAQILIRSMSGLVSYNQTLAVKTGVNDCNLETSFLRPGLYVIIIQGDVEKSGNLKMIVR